MKTLILFGSPRPRGNTATLLDAFVARLEGEILRVDAYTCGISPCVDCRRCWRERGCPIDDGMQDVYRWLETCDNVVLASPVHFSELSGPLLSVLSRLQTYFCARYFRHDPPALPRKRGVLLLAGAQPGTDDRAAGTTRSLMRLMRADIVADVRSMRTNEFLAVGDAEAIAQAEAAADILNQTIK